jgi:hypothetical protein
MPDVRCAFGLVRQGTRSSSLSPSAPRAPEFPQRVPASHRRACGLQPEPGLQHSRAVASPAQAAFVDIRPGKSNTQTITYASSLPVLAPSTRVDTSLLGRAPSAASHGTPRITSDNYVNGHSHSCNAQLQRLPLRRCTFGPQRIRHPRAIGLRLATPPGGFGSHSSFNGRT